MIINDSDTSTSPSETRLRQPSSAVPAKAQKDPITFPADTLIALLALGLFAIWSYAFRFHNSLGEDDLYRVLDGLLDGARSGSGFASGLHYGKWFSFGYIAAMYRFAEPATLQDPQRLMALINSIGFWAAVTGSACFWWSTTLLYGRRIAAIAMILFAFSPMMLDLSTSGHQILVAFALYSAASVLLFLPLRGIPAVLSSVAGSLLLLAALVTRAEIFLALPFLAVAKADLGSVPRFIRSAAVRSIGPALALAAFFLLRHHYVHMNGRELAFSKAFVGTWFRLSNIPKGLVVYFVGCGFATTILGLFAIVKNIRSAASSARASEPRLALEMIIGPLALLLPPLAFWILNPLPVRHFILCLAATGILIGWLISSYFPPPRYLAAYSLVLGVVLGNQVLGVISAPIILRHSPSPWIPAPGRTRITTRAPIGLAWEFHRSMQADREAADAFAESIRGTCEDNTLVFSDRPRLVFSHLYESHAPFRAALVDLHSLETLVAQYGGRTVLVMTELGYGWTHDAVAEVLADPTLNKYQLVRDPDTISIYDKTPIPPNRRARLGCKP